MKLINGIALLLFVGLPACYVTYSVAFAENYFTPYPLIDTKLPPGFSEAKFASIQVGMSKEEILELLPAPNQESDHHRWSYGNDGAAPFGDFAWIMFELSFDQEGKVIGKKRYVFHD